MILIMRLANMGVAGVMIACSVRWMKERTEDSDKQPSDGLFSRAAPAVVETVRGLDSCGVPSDFFVIVARST
jgi:hypothetical protein